MPNNHSPNYKLLVLAQVACQKISEEEEKNNSNNNLTSMQQHSQESVTQKPITYVKPCIKHTQTIKDKQKEDVATIKTSVISNQNVYSSIDSPTDQSQELNNELGITNETSLIRVTNCVQDAYTTVSEYTTTQFIDLTQKDTEATNNTVENTSSNLLKRKNTLEEIGLQHAKTARQNLDNPNTDCVAEQTKQYFSSDNNVLCKCIHQLQEYYISTKKTNKNKYIRDLLSKFITDIIHGRRNIRPSKEITDEKYFQVGIEHFQNEFAKEITIFLGQHLVDVAIKQRLASNVKGLYEPSKIFVLLIAPYMYLQDKNPNTKVSTHLVGIKHGYNKLKEDFKIKTYTAALKSVSDHAKNNKKYNSLILAMLEKTNIDENFAYIFIPPMFGENFHLLSQETYDKILTRVYFYDQKKNHTEKLGFGCHQFHLFEDVIIPQKDKEITKADLDEFKKYTGSPEICYKFFDHLKEHMQSIILRAKTILYDRMLEKVQWLNQCYK